MRGITPVEKAWNLLNKLTAQISHGQAPKIRPRVLKSRIAGVIKCAARCKIRSLKVEAHVHAQF